MSLRRAPVAVIDKKLRELAAQKAAFTARFKGLPATELESVRLLRDAKVAQASSSCSSTSRRS